MLMLFAACTADDSGPASTTTQATSTSAPQTTITTTATTTPVRTPPPTIETTAISVFEAWRRSDPGTVESHATEAVSDFLAHRPPGTVAWEGPQCEGAAGSTYCSWVSPEATVVLRVANEASRVDEARLQPPVGGVAVWPLTTAAEAATAQAAVDQGHSPWQIDPATVASMYAENVLGLDPSAIEATSDPVGVQISAGRIELDLVMTQPARSGSGGIWAIAEVQAHAPRS